MDTLLQVLEDTKRKHPTYKNEFDKINKQLLILKDKIDFDTNIKISVFYYDNYQAFKKCFSKKFIMTNNMISTPLNTNHYGIVISKLRDTKYVFVCKGIKDMYKICYLVEEKYKYVKEFKSATMPMTLGDFAKDYEIDFDILNSLYNEIISPGHYHFTKMVDVVKRLSF